MDISFTTPQATAEAVGVLVFEARQLSPAAAAIDEAADGALARALKASRMTGKPGEALELVAPGGVEADRVVLIGAGKKGALDAKGVEKLAAGLVRRLLLSGAKKALLRLDHVELDADAAARAGLGARLAGYRFDRYRTKLAEDKRPSLTKFAIAADDEKAAKAHWKHWSAVADGVDFARDLVSEPPNVLNPVEFAKRCTDVLEPLGVEVEVLGEAQMRKLGMHALLGVGQGSRNDSQLVVMQWKGAGARAKPLCLVGKGVCFDSGGISLKPGEGMWDMKGDMGGAAAVAGAMRALAGRAAKTNVVGVIGCVENMPDGAAQRPSDIVTSMSGQTIEVLNTDAEGRLVLADALWYARDRFKPKATIDLATLTGAMIIALGHEHAGLFSNDDDLANAVLAAGLEADELLWRMPLGPGYDKMIDTPNADMKNIGGREAGSITAAQFLKRFVEDAPWAHLDIAPTAWQAKSDDPRTPVWATGWGVRVLDRYVADNHE